MQLYRQSMATNKRDRASKTLKITLDERPERPSPLISSNRERVKLTKKIESVIRSSLEYREYITFLKENMNMKRCVVLRGLKIENGKKYSIELHHEPFTLFDLVDTIINYFDAMGEPLSVLKIAEKVMELHYNGIVGLIPLSATMHELVHADKIFIPLQYVYHRYSEFYAQFEDYISPLMKEKIQAKAQCSERYDEIQSDVLTPEFVYISIDGYEFPKIPDEWKNIMSMDSGESLT